MFNPRLRSALSEKMPSHNPIPEAITMSLWAVALGLSLAAKAWSARERERKKRRGGDIEQGEYEDYDYERGKYGGYEQRGLGNFCRSLLSYMAQQENIYEFAWLWAMVFFVNYSSIFLGEFLAYYFPEYYS